MKYIVMIDYKAFVFDDVQTATNHAEISKTHSESEANVSIEFLTDEEYVERGGSHE